MKAILTFHSIDDSGSVLSYPPTLFEYLLQTLGRSKIPIMDMASFLSPSVHRGVVLTFDDGMHSVLSNALPVLREYDACAHIFVTTTAVNSDQKWPLQSPGVPGFRMLDWGQLEKLHASGVKIEAHTKSHPDMRMLSKSQLMQECESADIEILNRIGRRPEFFAYPFGYHNQKARDFCRSQYRASVTTELRSISKTEDMAALPRLDTYYLRSHSLIDRLEDFHMKIYLRMRWAMRTVRGSHCIANYDDKG